MANTKRGSNNGTAVLVGIVAHAVVDLVTEAACPDCGTRVVLYVCPSCKKLVWPRRRRLPGAA